ncbi:hypothetical protein SDC9_83126 [bioreactor metagenome]|uniref:Uncharacterized protein n=1 Tax=bioreactor metagenome TaxID=1076179 RepID=A0A644Z8B7_9ZZZZ
MHGEHVGRVDVEIELAASGGRRIRKCGVVQVDAFAAEFAVLNGNFRRVIRSGEFQDRGVGRSVVAEQIDAVEHESLSGGEAEGEFLAPRLAAGIGFDVGIFRLVRAPGVPGGLRNHRPRPVARFRHSDQQDIPDGLGGSARQKSRESLGGPADDPDGIVAQIVHGGWERVQRGCWRRAVAVGRSGRIKVLH